MVAPTAPRVLIVDDEPDICTTLQARLTQKGYRVQVAHTCREAVTLLEQSLDASYHLALIDVRLPDGLGLDVLKTVKRLTPETTCLMMTAYATEQTEAIARDYGASGYFAKALPFERLLQLINQKPPAAPSDSP